MEAFSDGVLAIIITIMVLELSIPKSVTPDALVPLIPKLSSYILSFVFLFWLSLTPFVTGWMGETHFAKWPVAAYGVVLLCAAIAYTILTVSLLRLHGQDSTLAAAMGRDWKGKLSIVLYVIAVPSSMVHPAIAGGLYVLVALMWLVPDRRVERVVMR